jgi:predicted RNA-binding protein with PUA-like domain
MATQPSKPSASHWLVKQEPDDYPWSALVKDGRTAWTGVRNFLARNHLRAMKSGDLVLYYHSGKGKEIVGVAKVVREAYADPTAGPDDGDWASVDLGPVKPLSIPVTLAAIKADAVLREMMFVKQSRLSVSVVTAAEFDRILELGGVSRR